MYHDKLLFLYLDGITQNLNEVFNQSILKNSHVLEAAITSVVNNFDDTFSSLIFWSIDLWFGKYVVKEIVTEDKTSGGKIHLKR